MASSSLARCLRVARTLPSSSLLLNNTAPGAARARAFSTTPSVHRRIRIAEDMSRRTKPVLEDDMEDLWDALEDPAEVQDAPSSAHLVFQQQRMLLDYLRLIEHEMPKLVAFRKDFEPPTPSTPLVVRSVHYQGENHPATRKRVMTVAVDHLPLKSEEAVHKFQLLAGARWTPEPPKDAGVSRVEEWGNGYFKISVEDFPEAEKNLKWASDTLDKLVAEANKSPEEYTDVPVDLRHVIRKAQKKRKGDHIGSRTFLRPSIRDFPPEWLPKRPSTTTPEESAV